MTTTGRHGLASAGLGLLMLLACAMAPAQEAQNAQPSEAPQPTEKVFKNEQLDQLLAAVALYPDSLLSQLLMACTYPSDVTEAAAWVKANPEAKGDAAVAQVESKPWDPSVKSLVAFPQVLAQFGVQPDWVQKVGDAFLAQPEDVMASVQRLRAQAHKAGSLKSNEQQKVVVEPAPATSAAHTTVIQIEPANPEVVYVPTYNPTVVYGSWAYPSYPPVYYPPPPYYYHPIASGLAAGIAFGVGVAAINSCWGGFNWGRNDVNINVNRYNNVNVNNRISGSGNTNWSHNAANRRGTPYADQRSRQQYGQGVGGANNRAAYRGNDASRQRAQQSFNNSTGLAGNRAGGPSSAGNRNVGGGSAANRASGGGAGGNRAASGGGSRASSASRSNAFSGASSRQSAQRQSSRGQSSQRSMSSGASRSGAGRPTTRSAPQRSGGGRRR